MYSQNEEETQEETQNGSGTGNRSSDDSIFSECKGQYVPFLESRFMSSTDFCSDSTFTILIESY